MAAVFHMAPAMSFPNSAAILAIMIQEDSDIKWIWINKVEHKIPQFADDTQLMNNGEKNKSKNQYIQLINLEKYLACSWMQTVKYTPQSKTYATSKNGMASNNV